MSHELIDAFSGTGSGPIVGRATEDLNATVLALPLGQRIEAHRNNDLDVITVVLAGSGTATVEGVEHALKPGSILIIPKGCERSFESQSPDFRYLNIHKRRPALMPNMPRPPQN